MNRYEYEDRGPSPTPYASEISPPARGVFLLLSGEHLRPKRRERDAMFRHERFITFITVIATRHHS